MSLASISSTALPARMSIITRRGGSRLSTSSCSEYAPIDVAALAPAFDKVAHLVRIAVEHRHAEAVIQHVDAPGFRP